MNSISPLARENAKAKKLHLVQIAIDGKHCEPKGGKIEISGVCPPKLAKKLYKLINEITAAF